MSEKNFYIDKLKNNKNAQIIISWGSGKEGGSFTGIIKNELSISVGSNYASAAKLSSLEDLSQLLNQISVASSVATGSQGFPQIKLVPQYLTTELYQGSTKPEFSVEFTLIAIREGDNILNQIKQLYRLVLPTAMNLGSLGVGFEAPMGYRVSEDGNSNGTIWVSIGKWFKAPFQIVTNVTFNFSKIASSASGTPLYADGSITFRPFRDLTYEEFQQYFEA